MPHFDQTLIIIPTYNEATNIERMTHAIFEVSPAISILVIDDGSPDGTAEIVVTLQKEFSRLHLMKRAKKLGLGTAYVAGFKWALENQYEYVFEMDCDFSHDPAAIPSLLMAAKSHDLVIGSRYIEGIRVINWALHRLMLSLLASFYTRLITRMPIKDPTGGFKCFRRHALASLNLDKVLFKGYAFQIEINYKIWRNGGRIKEVPIIFYERREGASKMSRSLVIEAFFGMMKLRLMSLFGLL